jgi:Leucine-rich repeat (LRR) protein
VEVAVRLFTLERLQLIELTPSLIPGFLDFPGYLAQNMRFLTHLEMSGIRMGSQDQYRQAFFSEMPMWSRLRFLRLDSIATLSYIDFREVILACEYLRELQICHLEELAPQFALGGDLLRFMSNALPMLTKLIIERMQMPSLDGIEGFTSLKRLGLRGTKLLDIDAVVHLASNLEALEFEDAFAPSYQDDDASSPLVCHAPKIII